MTAPSTTEVQRPPMALYEVRTCHREIYRVEGDWIEQGDGWFTLWSDDRTLALRVPEADLRSVRRVDADEPIPVLRDPTVIIEESP